MPETFRPDVQAVMSLLAAFTREANDRRTQGLPIMQDMIDDHWERVKALRDTWPNLNDRIASTLEGAVKGLEKAFRKQERRRRLPGRQKRG